MPTLILCPGLNDDSAALWRAAQQMGWTVERLSNWRLPVGFRVTGHPVIYVEGHNASLIAEALGVSIHEPSVDWLSRMPPEYRGRDVTLMPLGAARSIEQPVFVKPSNDKLFPAGIYFGRDLPLEYPDELLVCISPVIQWEVEFRCFVLDRTVRAFSVYQRRGNILRQGEFIHSKSEEAQLNDFMDKLLADPRIELPRATVIDVGMIAGRGWAVVEQNSICSAEIFACEPREVLEVLQHAAISRPHLL